jgi:hypothetical protein
VWLLEEDDGRSQAERTWVMLFTLLAHGNIPERRQQTALPHVAHGEDVLTTGLYWWNRHLMVTLNVHRA